MLSLAPFYIPIRIKQAAYQENEMTIVVSHDMKVEREALICGCLTSA